MYPGLKNKEIRDWELLVKAERERRQGGPKRGYRVEVRGEIPKDLKEKISALHALCILQGKSKTSGKEKGN